MVTRRDILLSLGSVSVGAALGGAAGFAVFSAMGSLRVNTLVPDQLSDSIALQDQGAYSISSAFSRLVISTEATTFRLTTYNDCKTDFSAITKFGVWVNGAYFASFNPAGEGEYEFYLGLDAGLKTVEFVAGPQSLPTGQSLIGAYIVALTANKPMMQVLTPEVNRLLIYGDSIAVGDGCGTTVQQHAWPVLVRQGYEGSVELEAWGYRSLHEDCNTSGLRAAFVAKVAARNPTVIWLAIGTNDYGLNKWSAASFQTAYAALLDDLHTALPSAAIFAMSPLERQTETANGSGSTLGAYRTAIATETGSRGWATFVDGSNIIDAATHTSDGLHPAPPGTALIAAAVLAELA